MPLSLLNIKTSNRGNYIKVESEKWNYCMGAIILSMHLLLIY